MATAYQDYVQFLLIYIREAHPTDGWQIQANLRDGVLLASAKTLEQKQENATQCVRKLDIRFPTLIDELDNRVEQAYSAWPDRLYLIDLEGRVAFKGDPGPAGFRPEQLEAAIRRLLGSGSR